MTTPILALDLATATGWALRDRQGVVTHGVQTFPLRRGESPGMRWLRFRRWLRELLILGGVAPRVERDETMRERARELAAEGQVAGVVAFEAPLATAMGRRMGIGRELATIVEEEAAMCGLETTTIYPSTLKKHATGKGNSGKPAMIAAARARWGVEVTDDNEADALCVLAWALEEIGEGD